jgi:hypothetical protein
MGKKSERKRNSPLSPGLNPVNIRDIELRNRHLVTAMFLQERLEAVPAPADGDDEAAVLDHALGHGHAEARRAAHHYR